MFVAVVLVSGWMHFDWVPIEGDATSFVEILYYPMLGQAVVQSQGVEFDELSFGRFSSS